MMKIQKHIARTSMITATAIAVAAGIAAPIASAAAPRDADGRVSTVTAFQNTYNNPNAAYLAGASCLVPLGMADFTPVASTVACGITTTFSVTMIKLSVPATWAFWGAAPPQVEIGNPDILYSNGSPSVVITFSSPRRFAGFEISPQLGTAQSFKADYIDASGMLIGQITKTISGGKARLIGAKMFASQKVASIRVSSNGDFAIARLRYKP